jgi:hypothetical protein
MFTAGMFNEDFRPALPEQSASRACCLFDFIVVDGTE